MKIKRNGSALRIALAGALLGVGLGAATARANLVADWRFNSDLTDSSGFGHTANFNGGSSSFVTNGGRTSVFLDGVDDFLNVAASGNNLDMNNQSFAIAAWLTVHSVPSARREALIAGKADFSNLGNYALTVDYNNNVGTVSGTQTDGYTRRTTGANANVISTLYFDATEAYVNLVVTYDAPSKTLQLYRNNVLRDSLTAANIYGPTNTLGDVIMGKGFDATFLRADLDEVQIYNQSLDANHVAALFNGGNGPLAVPEPTAATLLGLGSLMLLRRRKP